MTTATPDVAPKSHPVAEQRPSPAQRQQRLMDAAERYMREEISVEQYEELERQFMPDYRGAIMTLARREWRPSAIARLIAVLRSWLSHQPAHHTAK